jgi:KDO2-lipid IV(A) lauroyltransferase
MRRRGMNIRKTLLRIIMPALRALPPRAASRVVAGIGRTEYVLVPGLRHRFERAVERSGRYFGCRWETAAIGRELAGNQIRWRTRDQLLDGLEGEVVSSLFHVRGREHLDEAFEQRRGVILLGNHFGAHLMPAHWMVREGYPLRLFMERPHSISKFLNRQFDSDGPLGQRRLFISRRAEPSESAGSILRAARILKAGMAVLIASDVRWTGPHTAPAQFLGQSYTFSATWVALAALTGAPVLPVFCRMEADGTHDLEFLPSFAIPHDAPGNGQAGHWVQRSLEAIEQRVREHPTNSNDYFFWDGSGASGAERAPAA